MKWKTLAIEDSPPVMKTVFLKHPEGAMCTGCMINPDRLFLNSHGGVFYERKHGELFGWKWLDESDDKS